MKKFVIVLSAICLVSGSLKAIDPCPPVCMENCPLIPPPLAPVEGIYCGLSRYTIGVGIVAIAAATVLILVSGNGSERIKKKTQ